VLDDNEATNDSQTGSDVVGRWFVIKLGDVGPTGSAVSRLGVSALLVPGNNRFTALRSFDAYACRTRKDAANPTCDGSIDAGWTKIVTSPTNAFPSVNPRPIAPDQTLRYFETSSRPIATHVKFVVTNNQCTAQPSYQGEQDADPGTSTDCRVGTGAVAPFPARNTEVQFSEVVLFGQSPTVDGTLVTTDH
jgi:extracellular elastinolytic metalloproteinase